jgi:DnaJ-class molecular chaperone
MNELITEITDNKITILWQGGLKSEYTLATLNDLIKTFTQEIDRFQSYRQRILAPSASSGRRPETAEGQEAGFDVSSAEREKKAEGLASMPCPPCGGTGRYDNTNFHCEWCGGTGTRAASEQRAGEKGEKAVQA